MEAVVSPLLVISTAVLAIPVVILLVEILAGVLPLRKSSYANVSATRAPDRVAVLVPAHNESTGLLPTLADIERQLRPGDRALIVADNCTDDTAAVARVKGFEVIERNEPSRRGKGYALEFGLQHLSSDPPDVVIMVDADCELADNAIKELATTSAATRRPVQALYLMRAPSKSQINQQVAEFAWRVRNWLRPQGLSALGLPCQLMGAGMAFPWDAIRRVDLASGAVVEDLKLGLDLALAGHPPLFCPSARLTSQFASSSSAARTQRARWEGGHIRMILATVPRLLWSALAKRDRNLLTLTLDLAVPPLSLLAFLVCSSFAVTSLYALFGFSSWALTLSTATLVIFLLAAFVAWLKCGRDVVPLGALPSIMSYILGKLGLYRTALFNRTEAQWIRTDRAKPE